MTRATKDADRRRSTLDDMNPNDEPVVYVNRQGNEVESADELTDGGFILRGEDAQKYMDGDAIPALGILSAKEAAERDNTPKAAKSEPANKDASNAASNKEASTDDDKS